MVSRIALFIALLAVGGVLGHLVNPGLGTAFGVAVAALAACVDDTLRGVRVERWLRRADQVDPPRMFGQWGEIVERARRALRGREQETAAAVTRLDSFLSAIQASPNGVVLLDAEGRIEWCNQTAADHFGFDAQRDVAQHVGNLLRDPAFAAYAAAGDFTGDVVIPARPSTPSRPVRVSVRIHPYGDGLKLMLSRDVTSIEQAETMRRDFVANVSHEIRTPLTVLAGFVEALQTLPLDEAERKRYLGLMSQQAQRMQGLVNDLLTLSRLEGSPLPGAADWVPVQSLQVQCEEEARGLASVLGKSQTLAFSPPPAMEVSGVAAEVLSAMANLVGNAVRYTRNDGTIDAGWRLLPDGRAEFSVRDNGVGIPPEHLPRLTERFYRVDRSRSRETGGTGLGLAIVKHVVQRHGGELRIESTVGVGSTFAFSLPASRVRASVTPAGGDAA